MRFAFLLLTALFFSNFHGTYVDAVCHRVFSFLDNLHCALRVSQKANSDPLLGHDFEISFRGASSNQYSKATVSLMDQKLFEETGGDPNRTPAQRNLGIIRLLTLTRIAITKRHSIEKRKTDEAKAEKADKKIRKLLGSDAPTNLEDIEPQQCAKVCKKLRQEMGPLNFRKKNTQNGWNLGKLPRLISKVITNIPRSFYRLSLYDSFSNT
ncbi:MAG: hypothetical protein ACPGUZ_00035 [Holosporaceae bacterium]